MPSRPAPLPDDSPQTVLTTRRAKRMGLSRSRTRASDMDQFGRGLRLRAGTVPDEFELLSALQELYPQAVFSHETAAWLWGMWLPFRDPLPRPHLSRTRRSGGTVRSPHAIGHELSDSAPVVEHRGLRVTSPAWTWTDLAQPLPTVKDLVAAGDSLLQRADGPSGHRNAGMHPLSRLDELPSLVATRRRFRGRGSALEALPLLAEHVDSAAETSVRLMVIEAGFPPPLVNPQLRLDDGTWIRPDLAWPDLKVCIEYEGDHHRTDRDQFRRDISRDRRMRVNGWIQLRVTGAIFTHHGQHQFLQDLRAAFSQAESAARA